MGTLKELFARTLRPGTTLRDIYQLERRLGQGGFGEVWAAVDRRRNEQVAIKLMPHLFVRRPEIQASLTQECAVLKTLAHPHICRVWDLVHDPTYGPLLITELIAGRDCVAATRGAPLEVCWRMMIHTLAALSYLHGRGVLHLDIKPANILVADHGVKLIDFGLATVTTPIDGAGTPAYMAPERIRKENTDHRADLYAVGVLLYECLTGTNPFHAPQPEAIRQKHLDWMPPPLSQMRPDCPAWMDTVIAHLLAKAPADRFPSAKAVLNELQLVLGDGFVQQAMGRASHQAFAPAAGQLIGREAIIHPLRAAWEGATTQPPAVHWVQITGAQGMGKSRLLRELKFTAQLAGCHTIWCDAATDASELVLQPIAEALATARAPLVICLDDYDQWGHQPEAHRLAGLLTTLATHPHPPTSMWCVMTGRALSKLDGVAHMTHYTVHPFTSAELTTYVCAIAPVPDAQRSLLVEQLQARTEGIPAKVAAVMQTMVARGYLATASGQWEEHLFADVVIDVPVSTVSDASDGRSDPETFLTLCRHDRATGHAGRALMQILAYFQDVTLAQDQNVALAVEAAECALAIGRYQEVCTLLQQCCDAYPAQRGLLLLWSGILLMAGRQYAQAEPTLREAVQWAQEHDDRVIKLRVRNQLARLALLQKRYDEAIAQFRTARAAVQALPPGAAHQITNNELGHALLLAGACAEAETILTEEIAQCRAAGILHRALRMQLWRSVARWSLDQWPQAKEDAEVVVREARQHQYLPLLAETYNMLGLLHCHRGHAEEGLAAYQQAVTLAYSVHDLTTAATATTNIGLEHLRQNQITPARHALETVLAFTGHQANATAIERAAIPANLGLAEIARQQGEYVKASTLLTTAETLATEHRCLSAHQFALVLTRGEIARDQGDQEKARDFGLQAKPFARSTAEVTAWQAFMASLDPPHRH
ncbi:MAG: protein kinase [Deltaproteobacteria bacterium]|nr:protein kinase [Deltaproteobacteria bacterium]